VGDERAVYRVLVGKTEGKRPLGRAMNRREENGRMDVQDVGCGGMDWIGLARDRDGWRALVNLVTKFRVPQNSGNFMTSYKLLASQEGLCSVE
jgi:hypothetical protein